MARGWGAVSFEGKCNCEDSDERNWVVVSQRRVASGKQFGKVISIVRCDKCGRQWKTSAKYVERLRKMF